MSRCLLISSLILLLNCETALGASWSISSRSEKDVREVVAKLLAREGPSIEGADGALILYDTVLFNATQKKGLNLGVNRITYVADPSAEHVATQTFDSIYGEVNMAKAWVLRQDDTFEWIADESIRVRQMKDDVPGSVVFAFTQAQPGDILGLSYMVDHEEAPFTYSIGLSQPYPVKVGHVTLSTDGILGYRLLMKNVPDNKRDAKVLKKLNGAPAVVRVEYRDIAAIASDSFMLPYARREPHVWLSYRGSYSKNFGWIFNKSWSQTAANMEGEVDKYVAPNKEIRAQAETIVAGISDPNLRTDALYRFVRDEILLIESQELDDSLRRPSKTLKSRNATSLEKGFLLASLMRSLRLPANISFARNAFWGELDETNPGLWQFSDVLVQLGNTPRWFNPSCRSCPPGILPHGLRKVPAFRIFRGLEEKNDDLQEKLWREAEYHAPTFVPLYLRRVAQQPWQEFVDTPGDPDAMGGTLTELVRMQPGNPEAEIELASWGFNRLINLKRRYEDPQERLNEYLDRRIANVAVLSAADQSAADENDETAVAMSGSFSTSLLPPASGDTWVLPAEIVFGKPFLEDWSGPDRTPFHVPYGITMVYECRMPLPEGWSSIQPVRPVDTLAHRFHYKASVAVDGDEVVLNRTITLKAGTSRGQRLGSMDSSVRKVHDFEKTALVLQAAVPK